MSQSSDKKNSGDRVVLEGLKVFRVEQALIFDFKMSNNQVHMKL